MKIGINALYAIPGKVGGSEIYLRCLLAALARIDSENEYVVFTNRESAGRLSLGENFRESSLGVRAVNRPARALWEQTVLPRRCRREGLNLLHSLGSAAPLRLPCPSVVTVLDLIYLRFPETFPWWTRATVRYFTARAAARAAAVIALSDYSRDEIMWGLDVSWDRIFSVPLGGGSLEGRELERPARVRLLREMGIVSPYVLTVSAAHPHKNLGRLLEAYFRFRREGGLHQLVVVGVRHSRHYQRLRRIVERLELDADVVFTGWIDDEAKLALYREASVFVYPSLLEGFGMPVLEAMRARVPVCCSDVPSLNEVAGEAALRFDPYSTGEMASALEECIYNEELRRRLVDAGLRHAGSFSWERTAARTLEIYRRIGEGRRK